MRETSLEGTKRGKEDFQPVRRHFDSEGSRRIPNRPLERTRKCASIAGENGQVDSENNQGSAGAFWGGMAPGMTKLKRNSGRRKEVKY